jgi:hypothetical protein
MIGSFRSPELPSEYHVPEMKFLTNIPDVEKGPVAVGRSNFRKANCVIVIA